MAAWGSPARAGERVALPDAIEPVVRLLEDTPRERLVEAVAERVRAGLGYRDALAGLMLAAVCNVEPRPTVGFKFHAVLVVQSVHLASKAAPEADRWMPIFWAMDYFKDSQARNQRERGWTLGPVDESAVPPAGQARAAFVEAMERWNEPRADAAVAGLARTGDPAEIWEPFFALGARDYRSIGHKAIDVANSHRVLEAIGWPLAEPILRSLAYALLMHEGGNPADRDDWADRPWRRNQTLADRIRDGWQTGDGSAEATRDLLAAIRVGSENDASDRVAGLLGDGVAASSIWDALFLAGVELLVRQPGIVALHAVTTTNALHYAFRHARDDRTRKLLLLQNAAFLPMFRQSMQGRGAVGEFALDALEPMSAEGNEAVDEIFADVSGRPMAAARKTLAYARAGHGLEPWIERARELVLDKSRNAHDYKFGGAVLEDVGYVSDDWRGAYLAGSVFALQGSERADNPLLARTRHALG